MKVIIIGGGPGGYPAALKLKNYGAEVKIIESNDFGGTCLNRGCIPSKALLEIGHRKHNFEEIMKFSDKKNIELKDYFSWEKIKAHKQDVVYRLRNSLEKLFSAKKIEIIKGKAYFDSPKSVIVETDSGKIKLDFDQAIIATGTKPLYPPPFSEYKNMLTDSDYVFDLPKMPEKMTIIGAGVIGLELACFFNAMSCQIEIVELMNEILPFYDQQLVKILKGSMEKRGIKFHLGVKTKSLYFKGNKKAVELENGEVIESDEILVAASRKAELNDLKLEKAKVEYDRWIKVSPDLKTSNSDIYAIGDVNGISLLAHSAERQGEIAAENIYGKKEEFDSNIVPYCIYTWPEMASVGMSKKEAELKAIKVNFKRAYFQGLGRAIASMNTEGLCQIMTDENGTILGAQIVGGPATEIIHLLAIAVKLKLNIKTLSSMIFAHPTMSEIIKEALAK
jgi:dihydrolipoamide dehydrogenase